ncbi:MAG: hypothetical protein VKJ24_15900 [Synechococcales bacterium]|nr:hypothetical protein [Synechococcales bacterium]
MMSGSTILNHLITRSQGRLPSLQPRMMSIGMPAAWSDTAFDLMNHEPVKHELQAPGSEPSSSTPTNLATTDSQIGLPPSTPSRSKISKLVNLQKTQSSLYPASNAAITRVADLSTPIAPNLPVSNAIAPDFNSPDAPSVLAESNISHSSDLNRSPSPQNHRPDMLSEMGDEMVRSPFPANRRRDVPPERLYPFAPPDRPDMPAEMGDEMVRSPFPANRRTDVPPEMGDEMVRSPMPTNRRADFPPNRRTDVPPEMGDEMVRSPFPANRRADMLSEMGDEMVRSPFPANRRADMLSEMGDEMVRSPMPTNRRTDVPPEMGDEMVRSPMPTNRRTDVPPERLYPSITPNLQISAHFSPPPPPPPIHITIGRIEIRATSPAAPPVRSRPAPVEPQTSLADYLKTRNGGNR